MTRAGINYILQKHLQKVRDSYPHLKVKVSPHTLRHTKAMHLIQGGISLDIVRDFLGHVDIKTTELYARANLEMKRAAIEKVSPAPVPKIPSWKENKSCYNGCNDYKGHLYADAKPWAANHEQDIMQSTRQVTA